ncbi:hypothetical protein RvVAR031_33960 [Agrobacterium vitis]|nr:hypothetical protein RvVAR031_33960 [Agrobacterium vitis]
MAALKKHGLQKKKNKRENRRKFDGAVGSWLQKRIPLVRYRPRKEVQAEAVIVNLRGQGKYSR